MSDEEVTALQSQIETLTTERDNLTAERDSLRDELTQMRETLTRAEAENAETKKLNYTLARQLDTRPQETFEDTLLKAMGVKK